MSFFGKNVLNVVVGFSVLIAGTAASARCWVEWQGVRSRVVCDNNSGGAGFDYTAISIKNNCRHSIRVALHYKAMTCHDYPSNGSSCLAEHIPEDQKWTTQGWWTLQPGQDAYIADTMNANVYFYAEALGQGRGLTWTGNERYRLNGRIYDFNHKFTANEHSEYTQSFSCN